MATQLIDIPALAASGEFGDGKTLIKADNTHEVDEPKPLSVQEEITAALEVGDGLEGRLHRERKQHPKYSQRDLGESLGVNRSAVWKAALTIDVMVSGIAPTTTSSANMVRTSIRNFLNRHNDRLNSEAKAYLFNLVSECVAVVQQLAGDQEKRAIEAAEDKTIATMQGVYVYTLPHYLNNPVLPAADDLSEDRTWMKVGMSSTDVMQRVKQQANTGLPEPPMLLRVYECKKEEAADFEYAIHRLLDAFDHNPNRLRGAGKEWFLTSLVALDELIGIIGLEIKFRYDEEDIEEEDE